MKHKCLYVCKHVSKDCYIDICEMDYNYSWPQKWDLIPIFGIKKGMCDIDIKKRKDLYCMAKLALDEWVKNKKVVKCSLRNQDDI